MRSRKSNGYWLVLASIAAVMIVMFCIGTVTIQARSSELIKNEKIARERYSEKVSVIESNTDNIDASERDIHTQSSSIGANSSAGGWECENKEDAEYLACVIYQEAGGDACCDLCRKRVADVVLNRVKDPRFTGTTVLEILTEGNPPQWGLYSVTGVVWPEKASLPGEKEAVERARRIAIEVLEGHHSDLSSDYIWCAEFPQGQDVIECDGIYFGK